MSEREDVMQELTWQTEAEENYRRAKAAEAEIERLRAQIRAVRRVYDLQCPVRPKSDYVDAGAWMAHRWWQTVLGAALSSSEQVSET